MVKKGYYGNESLDLSWNLRGLILYVTKIGWLDISHKNIIENVCVVYMYAHFKKDFLV